MGKRKIKSPKKIFQSIFFRLKTIPIIIYIFLILDLGAISCLVLAYGPYSGFRDWLITTAMKTMNHKYLARMLYNENMINKTLSNNYLQEINEETNLNDIIIGNEEKNYSSIYDEEILKRDEGSLYKVIELKEKFNVNGYLVAVYDPSKVKLGLSTQFGIVGERVRTISKNNNAVVAINAGGFEDPNEQGNGGRPLGTVIKDGKIIWQGLGSGWGGGLIGFNNDNKLVLTKESASSAVANGMRDAVDFGPFLIVNGKAAYTKGNGGSGEHPRTVIAQRQDGIVLFLIIDGNGNKVGYRGGANYIQMIEILQKYKAYNAANLDGGASTTLVIENKLYNKPCAYNETGERWQPNAWIVTQ